jgi:hypothetical protein
MIKANACSTHHPAVAKSRRGHRRIASTLETVSTRRRRRRSSTRADFEFRGVCACNSTASGNPKQTTHILSGPSAGWLGEMPAPTASGDRVTPSPARGWMTGLIRLHRRQMCNSGAVRVQPQSWASTPTSAVQVHARICAVQIGEDRRSGSLNNSRETDGRSTVVHASICMRHANSPHLPHPYQTAVASPQIPHVGAE